MLLRFAKVTLVAAGLSAAPLTIREGKPAINDGHCEKAMTCYRMNNSYCGGFRDDSTVVIFYPFIRTDI